jgi:hypothetical protein
MAAYAVRDGGPVLRYDQMEKNVRMAVPEVPSSNPSSA